jgi:threonylcarbamoyladenosine tRNA methylthiotransferase MtaB
VRLPILRNGDAASSLPTDGRPKVIVTGCWATSDPHSAAALPGVTGVITHHDNIAQKLQELLKSWDMNGQDAGAVPPVRAGVGAKALPLLGEAQIRRQRALLKIQDGCDAHCTYCIIPSLRPKLWSKPLDDAVEEARRLVDAGHVEIVLTGIFLAAYGQTTSLRRRQGNIGVHPLVVPHLHLPLQSGSAVLLRRMNRQYTRDDYLRLVDRVTTAWHRVALTTDIIVGFPGESNSCFEQTLDIVERARFIHIHAFPFSPRPGTAAARWQSDFIRGPVVGQRLNKLHQLASQYSHQFRTSFIGQTVEVLTERNRSDDFSSVRHGRCERYFDVQFYAQSARPGDLIRIRVDRATPTATFGTLEAAEAPQP